MDILTTLAFFSPGPTEIIVILLIALLLFGAKKLPELARGMGKSVNEFKNGLREVEQEINTTPDDKDSSKAVVEDKKADDDNKDDA